VKKRFLSTILIVLFVLASLNTSFAHPHVFVDAQLTLVFDAEGLTSFQETWAFDEMFSEFIFEDYDKNKNRQFEKAEIAKIKEEVFDNLKNSGYFHVVTINGKPFKVTDVNNFSVKVSKGQVVYAFTIPCKQKYTGSPLVIDFSISDPTVYTDIIFTKNTPQLAGNSKAFDVSHLLDDGVQPSGQVLAQTLKITVKRK